MSCKRRVDKDKPSSHMGQKMAHLDKTQPSTRRNHHHKTQPSRNVRYMAPSTTRSLTRPTLGIEPRRSTCLKACIPRSMVSSPARGRPNRIHIPAPDTPDRQQHQYPTHACLATDLPRPLHPDAPRGPVRFRHRVIKLAECTMIALIALELLLVVPPPRLPNLHASHPAKHAINSGAHAECQQYENRSSGDEGSCEQRLPAPQQDAAHP